MNKEWGINTGIVDDLIQRLKNAVSLNPKALETVVDFYQTTEPKEITHKVLSSILKYYGFTLGNERFPEHNINAKISLLPDQSSVLTSISLLIDRDEENRIYLRAIAHTAQKSVTPAYPTFITERIRQSHFGGLADHWISSVIDKQLQPVAKTDNPCMQGILEATKDLRKPTLSQLILNSIKRKTTLAQPLQ